MSLGRKQLRTLLKKHEANLELLIEHSNFWQDEDYARGNATIKNITLQTEVILEKLSKTGESNQKF